MAASKHWQALKRWSANVGIVAILAIVVCNQFPSAPEALQAIAAPLANRLGIGQGRWNMFAPVDSVNHRLRAELLLRDGRTVEWQPPDLARQSVWERFVGHRRSEYIDNAAIFEKQHPAIWETLAERLVEEFRDEGHDVLRLRIILERSSIPPPRGTWWPPRTKEAPYDDQRVVYRRKYP